MKPFVRSVAKHVINVTFAAAALAVFAGGVGYAAYRSNMWPSCIQGEVAGSYIQIGCDLRMPIGTTTLSLEDTAGNNGVTWDDLGTTMRQTINGLQVGCADGRICNPDATGDYIELNSGLEFRIENAKPVLFYEAGTEILRLDEGATSCAGAGAGEPCLSTPDLFINFDDAVTAPSMTLAGSLVTGAAVDITGGGTFTGDVVVNGGGVFANEELQVGGTSDTILSISTGSETEGASFGTFTAHTATNVADIALGTTVDSSSACFVGISPFQTGWNRVCNVQCGVDNADNTSAYVTVTVTSATNTDCDGSNTMTWEVVVVEF